MLSIGEEYEDLQAEVGRGDVDKENAVSRMEDLISQISELKGELESNLDNMPDGLRDGDTGQLLQERIDALESAETEAEAVKDEIESAEENEEEDQPGWVSAFENWGGSIDG